MHLHVKKVAPPRGVGGAWKDGLKGLVDHHWAGSGQMNPWLQVAWKPQHDLLQCDCYVLLGTSNKFNKALTQHCNAGVCSAPVRLTG